MVSTQKTLQRILVAEDEKPMARALEIKLSKAGFKVEVAYDGEDALQRIQKNGGKSFDLIILDLVMPKKDGFEVLTALKAAKIKTPVIVTSNLSQEEDAKRAKALGARDYFIKSNTPITEITAYVRKFLKT